MNFLVGVFLVLSFCVIASAGDTDNSASKVQSADDYYDGGGSIDQQPPQMDPNKSRNPASGDLPYSDDEIQKNTPENYTPKNMPIDQD
jgi:hypothetical protein